MTPLDYHCKICGKPGVAYYDPARPVNNLEAWQSALCCNRCHTFRNHYQKAKNSVEKLCVGLIHSRNISDASLKNEVENRIRQAMMAITRRLAALCSDYYCVVNIWEQEFVNLLMAKPEGCNKAVNAYRIGVEKISDRKTIAF